MCDAWVGVHTSVPSPGEARELVDIPVDHEALVQILALEPLEQQARQRRGREEQRQKARREPGGQGEHPRIEVAADLGGVVLAQRVRRGLEPGRVPATGWPPARARARAPPPRRAGASAPAGPRGRGSRSGSLRAPPAPGGRARCSPPPNECAASRWMARSSYGVRHGGLIIPSPSGAGSPCTGEDPAATHDRRTMPSRHDGDCCSRRRRADRRWLGRFREPVD